MALGAGPAGEETVTVMIQGRQFVPARTLLHLGQPTRLIFKNQDSELHAVVPFGLFAGESLNVAGNGAPEFGPDGLKRVIVPPDGTTEIYFTPAKPGEYRYLCDMPGHEMKATIVVE
jgi:plastocyanin